jgi:SAM-dependent methyltransferase
VTDSESSFRTLEKSGWETAVADYEDAFARLAAQSIGPLLDALQLKRGARLLDAACGAGALAAEAARRGIQARGVDFSAAMVALAKERHSKLRFEEGDVEALPFPDACFDGVAMNFGLLHLDQPRACSNRVAAAVSPCGLRRRRRRLTALCWAPSSSTGAWMWHCRRGRRSSASLTPTR